ncbi:MAG: tRNA (adenosine(37)-N6)-dimethylallyltransferase MiaA [Deltaproteobacteria bacterium]|nr:tRNA (adenosine(37)-N6)-dimethylallyltransferase MiaA [Deltaproteobacteria bacterium]
MTDRPRILVLVGPTAAGKTILALEAAERLGGEIISADAVAVYKGLDIGTAKPSPAERRRVPHHLIDIIEPEAPFDAARFSELARAVADGILARGGRVIVVGGSGLYLRAMIEGLFNAPPVDPDLRGCLNQEGLSDPEGLHRRLAQCDPQAAARISPKDRVRTVRALEVFLQTGRTITEHQAAHRLAEPPYQALKLGLILDQKALARRIENRTREMMAQGWVEEVTSLLDQGVDPQAKPLQSVGYKQIVGYLKGKMSRAEAFSSIVKETKKLAKRQMTWFRADEEIKWLSVDDKEAFIHLAREFWEDVDVSG